MQNTKNVVDYVVASRFESIPEQALTVAKCAVQDCVGVALAGARHPGGTIPAEWARKCAGAETFLSAVGSFGHGTPAGYQPRTLVTIEGTED